MDISTISQFRKLLKTNNPRHFTRKAIEVLFDYVKDCNCDVYNEETDSYPIDGYSLVDWEQVKMSEEEVAKLDAQYGGYLPKVEVYKGNWLVRPC